MKKSVIDEVHYMGPHQTIRLEHERIVKGSVILNVPVKLDYKNSTITTSYPDYYKGDEDGMFDVVISYMYESDGE